MWSWQIISTYYKVREEFKIKKTDNDNGWLCHLLLWNTGNSLGIGSGTGSNIGIRSGTGSTKAIGFSRTSVAAGLN